MKPARRFEMLLALPLVGWLIWLLVLPLAIVALYSFLARGPYGNVVYQFNLGNYERLFDGLYLGIYGRSFQLATLTTLTCLVLGFPMAYVLATAPARLRTSLFVLLMVPFLTNFVVRVYAIRILLGTEGPLNAALISLGIIQEPLNLTDTTLSVYIGMITNYLPFMVLPLYVTLEKFDFTLIEAAHDLGASGLTVLRRVLLPLAMPGLISGSILVFVPALGEFLIPDLLGGARTMLLGNLIAEQILKTRDWPFGAALTMLLVLVMTIGFGAQRRVMRRA